MDRDAAAEAGDRHAASPRRHGARSRCSPGSALRSELHHAARAGRARAARPRPRSRSPWSSRQIALGGWVARNYAALACVDFPTCHGQWCRRWISPRLPARARARPHGRRRTAGARSADRDPLDASRRRARTCVARGRAGRPYARMQALPRHWACSWRAAGPAGRRSASPTSRGLPLALAVAHNAVAAAFAAHPRGDKLRAFPRLRPSR